jgi:homoserine dehydrogenase
MKTIPICLIGFGNVGQAFARLLLKKRLQLAEEHQVQIIVTAVMTGSHGVAIQPNGLDLAKVLEYAHKDTRLDELNHSSPTRSFEEVLKHSQAQTMLENTPVNYRSGQPAIDHLTAALGLGMHAITANKGPVLHGYERLRNLAAQKGVQFLFESTVMDGAPIFSLFRKTLPAIELNGFEGILNSCTNLLLERMEAGDEFEQAVEYARSIGITETDPSGDIDGWDAAIKTALLANVLMDAKLNLDDIDRTGIREISTADIQSAKKAGERWKLVCRAQKDGAKITASVHPQRVNPGSPFFNVIGTSSFVLFRTDCLPGLGILESDPGPETTAYGLLSDLLTIFGK